MIQKLMPEHHEEVIKAMISLSRFHYYWRGVEIPENIEELRRQELAEWIEKEEKGEAKLFIYKQPGLEKIDALVFYEMKEQKLIVKISQRLEFSNMDGAIKEIVEKSKEIGIEDLTIYDDVDLLNTFEVIPGFFGKIEQAYNITTQQVKDKITENKISAYKSIDFVKVGEFEFFNIYKKRQEV